MNNKLVLIRITQSNFNFEEGQEFYAYEDEDGFILSADGDDLELMASSELIGLFISDGEAELVGEEYE